MAGGMSFVCEGGNKKGAVSRVGVVSGGRVLVFSYETCGGAECSPVSLPSPKQP